MGWQVSEVALPPAFKHGGERNVLFKALGTHGGPITVTVVVGGGAFASAGATVGPRPTTPVWEVVSRKRGLLKTCRPPF